MNYQNIYNKIIEKGKNRKLNEYKEIHHIVPKCMGGSNESDNLVELTAREHFLCHMLLCEIYPTNNKLRHALFFMAMGKQIHKNRQYVIGSRTYERLKKEHSKFLTGKKQSKETRDKKSKSMKGKIVSEKTKQKISKVNSGRKITWKNKISDSLKGRKITWNTTTSKPILQLDLEGNFIKEWSSIAEAKRWLGSGDIQACVNCKQKQAGGCLWKFKQN